MALFSKTKKSEFVTASAKKSDVKTSKQYAMSITAFQPQESYLTELTPEGTLTGAVYTQEKGKYDAPLRSTTYTLDEESIKNIESQAKPKNVISSGKSFGSSGREQISQSLSGISQSLESKSDLARSSDKASIGLTVASRGFGITKQAYDLNTQRKRFFNFGRADTTADRGKLLIDSSIASYKLSNKAISKKLGMDEFKTYDTFKREKKGKTPLDSKAVEFAIKPLEYLGFKVKNPTREDKASKLLYEFQKYGYETVREKPLKLPLIAVAGAVTGYGLTGLASVSSKASTLASVGGKVAGGLYFGSQGYRYMTEKEPQRKYKVLAETTIDTSAFALGNIAGSSQALKRYTPLPSSEPKIKFETFKAQFKGKKGSVIEKPLYQGLTYSYGQEGKGGALIGYYKGDGVRFGSKGVKLLPNAKVIAETPAQREILFKSIPSKERALASKSFKLMKAEQFTKSKFYDDEFYNSKVLSKSELGKIFNFAKKTKSTLIYGSASAEIQKRPSLRREFGDVDLQLKTTNPQKSSYKLARDLGQGFKVVKGKSLIQKEINIGSRKQWINAVDIHGLDAELGYQAPASFFGLSLTQKPVKYQGREYSPLSREALAKGASIFTGRTNKKGEFKFSPESYRQKDVPDYFTDYAELQKQSGSKESKRLIKDIAKDYPSKMKTVKTETTIYSPPSPSSAKTSLTPSVPFASSKSKTSASSRPSSSSRSRVSSSSSSSISPSVSASTSPSISPSMSYYYKPSSSSNSSNYRPSYSSYSYSYISKFKSPSPSPSRSYRLGSGGGFKVPKLNLRFKSPSRRYTPSLTSGLFNIRGKPTRADIKGLGIRPIPISEKKKY